MRNLSQRLCLNVYAKESLEPIQNLIITKYVLYCLYVHCLLFIQYLLKGRTRCGIYIDQKGLVIAAICMAMTMVNYLAGGEGKRVVKYSTKWPLYH